MPYLPETTIRLPIGATGLSFDGPTVVRDDPARAGVNYDYTWLNPDTRMAAGALPGTLAVRQTGFGIRINRLVGNAPTTGGVHVALCVASVSTQQTISGAADPDAPYEALVTFVTGIAPPDNLATFADKFNRLDWRDNDRFRIGMQHDDPNYLYLFMGLPIYAPVGNGVTIEIGPAPQQWLPVENIQQFIAPRVTSNNVPSQLLAGPNIGADARSDEVPTIGRAQNRTNLTYGPATLRVLWHEDYLSHGGPYGLYQASVNMGLSVPWVYFQRDPPNLAYWQAQARGTPLTGISPNFKGRVLRYWTGYVGQLDDNLTRQGRIVTCTIYPDAAVDAVVPVRSERAIGGLAHPSLDTLSVLPE